MNGARLRLVMLAAALVAVTSAHASEFASKLAEDPKPEVQTDAEQLDLIRGKLASADLALRAWGAWEASERQQRDLAPNVLAALRRTLTEPEVELQEFVLRALLDAAIRLDVRLSAKELAGVESLAHLEAQVLVLASRDPAEYADLLEHMHDQTWPKSKIAADNLLARGAPDRATAVLIPDAQVHIVVRVRDGSRDLHSEVHSASLGCGTMTVPKDFPPTVLYELFDGAAKDTELLADGPRPIRVRRRVHTQLRIPISSSYGDFDASQHALDLLRWIVDDRAEVSPLDAKVNVFHHWTSAMDYLDKVGAEITSRRAAWRTLLDALVARELIPADRIPTADPIEVEVEDLRADRSVPLPELPR